MSSSEQTLARFVYMAERTGGAALADLLLRTLRDAHVFFFGELLDLPSVKQVSGSTLP